MGMSTVNLNKILAKINKSLESKGDDVGKVAELIVKLDEAQVKADTIEADLKLAHVEINKLKTDLGATNAILKNKEDKVIVIAKKI